MRSSSPVEAATPRNPRESQPFRANASRRTSLGQVAASPDCRHGAAQPRATPAARGDARRDRRARRGDRRAAWRRRRHRAGAGVPLHLHHARLRRAEDHAGLPRDLARHHRLHLAALGQGARQEGSGRRDDPAPLGTGDRGRRGARGADRRRHEDDRADGGLRRARHARRALPRLRPRELAARRPAARPASAAPSPRWSSAFSRC